MSEPTPHEAMKVLHFVPYFPPQRLGGVGEFVAGLHHGLLEAGVQSRVITAGRPAGEPHVERLSPRALGWFLGSLRRVGEAARHDVVHCQSGEALPVILLLSLRRKRPKILATFHVSAAGIASSFRPYSIEGRRFATTLRPFLYRTVAAALHGILDRLTIWLADEVNTISQQSALDVLGTERGPRAPVIYYGLPDLEGADQRITLDPVELLYVGCGGHRKRVATLPFVLRDVRRELPDARLRIVGFTPESEPEVVALLDEMGLLDAVDFVGVKTSAELRPYYESAQVLAVPSAYEGLPFVILEAMRCGLPVVATRVSGHPEAIVDGENGFLVDLDDPRQMADRCLAVLRAQRRDDAMAAAARQTFEERFRLPRQVQEYRELYAHLLGADPSATTSGRRSVRVNDASLGERTGEAGD